MNRSEVNPMGFLADNWIGAQKTPALIVNPKASPIDMLAWIGGELRSLEASCSALSDLVSGENAGIEFAEFEAIFIHRLAPVVRVFDLALCELIDQRCQAATIVATQPDGGE